MRERIYTIIHLPVYYKTEGGLARNASSAQQRDNRNLYHQALTEQHDSLDKWSGTLAVDIRFFMRLPMGHANQITKEEQYFHVEYPDIYSLLNFIRAMMKETILEDESMISMLSCSKIYDAGYRTEITIRSLDEAGQ